ncbi:PHD finger family protein [Rhynchospora pubera]|uniref:PHD finger family protein n=1 Tax=Rhynchospora pubera TaxID=906938 RepID=A0AAV8HAZ0_9POAL|nr:PHD finger family protein [Rhynchospora pubera]
MDLVGKPICKKLNRYGVYKGVVDSFDPEAGCFKVSYEDGDSAKLYLQEVRSMLAETKEEISEGSEETEMENGSSDANQNGHVESTPGIERGSEKKLSKKRRKSELGSDSPVTPLRRSSRQAANAAKAAALSTPDPLESAVQVSNRKPKLGSPSTTRRSGSRRKGLEVPDLGPKEQLPPSSTDLDLEGLPALDFFAVYAFLRSMSKQFFLGPFHPETFLAALQCTVVNPLIDSVHFALLHALKGHLEVLSNEGSPSAAHCIRNLNWDLLDLFTWPVFLAEYLLIHGSETKPSIKLPQLSLLSIEYYKQPAEAKLELLRCLCDDVIDVGSIHAELEQRETRSELDPTEEISQPKKRGRKRKFISSNAEDGSVEDGNSDECYLCGIDGSLICCDGCPKAFHSKCIGAVKDLLPDGDWYCPECSVRTNEGDDKSPSKLSRGGEIVGIDPHGRAYIWSCDHLLVSESYETDSSCHYYSKKDLPSVLGVLKSTHPSYYTIVDAISACSGLSADSVDHSSFDLSHKKNLSKSLDMEAYSTLGKLPIQYESENGTIAESEDDKLAVGPGWNRTGKSATERKKGGEFEHHSDVICYTNSYSFGRLASAISVEFARILAENKELKKPIEDLRPLQMKAIANKSPSFCWYTYKKLPLVVQKESCGWCHLCRSSDDESDNTDCVFKTGLDNTQSESLSKTYTGLPSEKNRTDILSAIQQLLLLEERVRGLLSGPWEDPQYNESWRRAVLKASNVLSLGKSLLKLESSLRRVALFADWTRPVDSTAVVGSAVHISIRPVHNVSKGMISGRKPGRPSRKSFIRIQSNSESAVGINWWRGGRLSREVFHWKMLPQTLASKAARQAGWKRIPTVVYPDGSDIIARRLKCVAWRATVEMSKTVSQLVFMIKELESYIKWADISTAEPFSPVTKETKKTAKQFKKVIVRRKEMDGTNTRYLLDFGKRKKEQIPPIVVRYGTKHEEPTSERVKYWLGENYVPLNLVRAFEERKFSRQLKKKDGSTSSKHTEPKPKKRAAPLDKLNDSRSKKRRRCDAFDYLLEKAQKMEKKECSHCNQDVPISEAVNCQLCEGFFHRKHFRVPKGATTAVFTCAKCKDDTAKTKKVSPLKKKPKASPHKKKKKKKGVNLKKKVELRRSERLLAMKPLPKKPKKKSKNSKKAVAKPKKEKVKPSAESVTDLTWPKRKRTISPHSYWLNGLQWTRKPDDDLGNDFRRSKVVLHAQNLEMESVSQPVCSLCSKDTTEHLYIACEKCGEWFHGDAYQVTPENIHKLIGFKCHKCRKRGTPTCPHMDLPQEELNGDQTTSSFLKGILAPGSITGTEDGFAEVHDLMDMDEVHAQATGPAVAICSEVQTCLNGRIGSTDDHLNMAQKDIEGFLKVLTGGDSSSKETHNGTSVDTDQRGDSNTTLFENEILVPVFEIGLSGERCTEMACLQAATTVGVGTEDFMHVEQGDGTSSSKEHLNEKMNSEVVNGFAVGPSLDHLKENLDSSYQKMEGGDVVHKLEGLG